MFEYLIWQLPLSNRYCFAPARKEEVRWREYVLVYVYKTEKEINLEKL